MEKSFVSKVFLVVLIGVLILLLRLFWAYISAIILALLIASAFYPLYAWVKKLLKANVKYSKSDSVATCPINSKYALKRSLSSSTTAILPSLE